MEHVQKKLTSRSIIKTLIIFTSKIIKKNLFQFSSNWGRLDLADPYTLFIWIKLFTLNPAWETVLEIQYGRGNMFDFWAKIKRAASKTANRFVPS